MAGFTHTDVKTRAAVLFALVLIPVAEVLIPPDYSGMEAAEEEMAKNNPAYDYLLYGLVLLVYLLLFLFLPSMKEDLSLADRIGRIATRGLLCGSFASISAMNWVTGLQRQISSRQNPLC